MIHPTLILRSKCIIYSTSHQTQLIKPLLNIKTLSTSIIEEQSAPKVQSITLIPPCLGSTGPNAQLVLNMPKSISVKEVCTYNLLSPPLSHPTGILKIGAQCLHSSSQLCFQSPKKCFVTIHRKSFKKCPSTCVSTCGDCA